MLWSAAVGPIRRFRGQIAAARRVVLWIGAVPAGSTFSRPPEGVGSAVVCRCGTDWSVSRADRGCLRCGPCCGACCGVIRLRGASRRLAPGSVDCRRVRIARSAVQEDDGVCQHSGHSEFLKYQKA